MSVDNTPQGTVNDEAPADFQSGVEAIDELLDDSDIPNTAKEDQGQEAKAETEEAEDTEVEVEADDAEETDADEETEQADDEEPDESEPEASQGRFVTHDAKVKLADGTVTTVGQLAKSPLLQSDYTRKSQAMADERKTVDQSKVELTDYAQRVRAERDLLLQTAQQFLPQPPDKAMIGTDFIGYQEAKAEYDEKMQLVQNLRLQSQQQIEEQQHREQTEVQNNINEQGQRLVAEMPELAKPENFRKFMSETSNVLTGYGFSQDELDQVVDHRFFKVFRDLQRYHKARKSAPKVKKDLKGKPVLKGSKRMDTKQKTTRDVTARAAQAKQSGSMEDAAASLMDFDL